MQIIQENSLAETLEALNDRFFFGMDLTEEDKRQAANWIAKRHYKFGRYANMFAPTDYDFLHFKRVFTGEKLASKARTAHILGEEACRALILLSVANRTVQSALNEASEGMIHALKASQERGEPGGTFCCGTCTCALWRHLAVGGLTSPEMLLESGLKHLRAHRDGEGRWYRYPFYYALLTLTEIDLPAARAEIRYAAPACERSERRLKRTDRYTRRRLAVIARAMSLC
ncbi:MAG: hypothetical protein JW797_07905 [Bradymonadales bacterium]|nr:hypothetical protein [Bradymonadales bacterium]